MQRLFLFVGVLLIVIGLAWPWLSKLPFGRLPGDINIEHDGFGFHFPIVTSIMVSLVVTVLLWLFRR
jgi:hypothetical protein